jgi:hypothetical protein
MFGITIFRETDNEGYGPWVCVTPRRPWSRGRCYRVLKVWSA